MVYTEDFYLRSVDSPMFETEKPVQMKEPEEIPMPFIKGATGKKDVIYVTRDWYVKKKKKRLAKMSREKKDVQIEMMQLIGQRDILRHKLGELDPSKKKDNRKIISINIKIKDIDAELAAYQQEYDVDLDELDHGSKLGRFIGKMKRAGKKAIKKVKKFCKKHQDAIVAVASIVIPVILAAVTKKLFAIIA